MWRSIFELFAINDFQKTDKIRKVCLSNGKNNVFDDNFLVLFDVNQSTFHEVMRKNDFYPRNAMLARVIVIATCPSVRLSVSPSVRHAPGLCQNEES